jgi:hypothetical protein
MSIIVFVFKVEKYNSSIIKALKNDGYNFLGTEYNLDPSWPIFIQR